MREQKYPDDFDPTDWEFCGTCQVCEMKYRCLDSPYYREPESKGVEHKP